MRLEFDAVTAVRRAYVAVVGSAGTQAMSDGLAWDI